MPKRMEWFGLVSLLLVLLVSACTGGQPVPPATSNPAAGTVKIYKSPT